MIPRHNGWISMTGTKGNLHMQKSYASLVTIRIHHDDDEL